MRRRALLRVCATTCQVFRMRVFAWKVWGWVRGGVQRGRREGGFCFSVCFGFASSLLGVCFAACFVSCFEFASSLLGVCFAACFVSCFEFAWGLLRGSRSSARLCRALAAEATGLRAFLGELRRLDAHREREE